MPRPNFFIAGAAKCGTTSLHAYLRQHPDVFLCEPKEPRYYDTDLPSHPRFCVRDADAYADLFMAAENHAVVGEASPSYLVSEVAAERIYSDCPNARVLISLRNPVDFMFSLHRQFVGSCNEDLHDFAEALAAEPERARGERVPADAHYPAQLRYRHNAHFAEQVERFLDRFGTDQVKVVLMDDLAADARAVHDDVVRFLDLPPNPDVDLAATNIGAQKRLRNFRVRKLMKRFPIVERTVRRMPVSLGTALSDAWVRVTGEAVNARTALDETHRNELLEEFGPEIERLAALIGRDLSAWKV